MGVFVTKFSSSRSAQRAAVVIAAASLVAAFLAALPSAASADDVPADFKMPKSEPNKNLGHGGSAALAAAVAKARTSKKPSEVVAARTATETVFANPDGTVKVERAQSPIRAKQDGKYVPLDPSLVKSGDGLQPKVSADDVTFSADGAGPLASLGLGKTGSIAVTLLGSVGAPAIVEGVATYPVADAPAQSGDGSATPSAPVSGPSTDGAGTAETPTSGESVQVATKAGGFSARVLVGAQPKEAVSYEFGIDAEGLTPSLAKGVLSFTDADGDVVAASSPLQMWDSQVNEAGLPSHTAAVDADLAKTASGWVLTLTPSQAFLADPKTQYPVTIDPDISTAPAEDTYYYNGQPSTSPQSLAFGLLVGNIGGVSPVRSLMTFGYNELLGYDVKDADLTLRQYFNNAPAPCVAKETDLFPVTQEVNVSTITWATRPTSVSTDSRWAASKSFNHGTTCAQGSESIDVTSMVDGWAGQHLGKGLTRQAIELRAANEADATQGKAFCSADWDATSVYCTTTATVPTLSVTYQPQLGSQSWYSLTNHTINDHSNIAVNNQTGNGVVQAHDLNANGVGLDLDVSRTYNTQNQDLSSLGYGWSLSIGPDVWLEHKSDTRFDYHGPGGTTFTFFRQDPNPGDPHYNDFTTPTGGVDADLSQSGTNFTLTFHSSQAKFVFSDNAAGNDNAYLTQLKDRSGNHIDVAYSGTTSHGVPKMSAITDTGSRTYTVTYTGDYVTKIANTATGVGTRNWTYTYTGNYLTGYTDPDAKAYTYTYADATVGPDLLTKIEDPSSSFGARPTTYIDYDTNTPINTNQVFGLRYRYGTGTTDAYKYTWDYNTAIVSSCDGNGDFSTVVTDPNNHDTTYCFQNRDTTDGSSKTWVYDAMDHAKSVEYSADKGPTNITSPTGQGSTDGSGSTVAKYADDPVDQLSKVTNPKSDAAQSATTGFQYSTPGSSAGSKYLPSAVKGTEGTCNRFGYDPKGRTTDSYTGIAATSEDVNSCGGTGSSGSKHGHRDYDDATGNVIKSWDANAGSSSPADDDSTIYSYWKTTDTGYVAGSKDLLKSIRKPGGNCAATVAAGRKLCTSYTYDAAGRIASTTNGNAVVTKYTRDTLDRTTGVFFGGSGSCDLLSSNCLKYTYDAEGNLTKRTEDLTNVTNFDYDQLNRQTTITNPAVLLKPVDLVASAFDGVGNVTEYAQNTDHVSDYVYYYYDSADTLSSVLDSTGFTYLSTDADGRVTAVAYPKPTGTAGMRVDYDYTKGGKPKSLKIKNASSSSTYASVDYDYTKTLYVGTFQIQVESSQLQNRTSAGSLTNYNSDVDYTYNNDGQLTKADAASGTDYTYTYDNVGNITKEDNGTAAYYGYDRAGELCWQGPNNGTNLARACPTTPTGDTTVNQDTAGNSTGTTSDPITYNNRDQVTNLDGYTSDYRDLGNDIRKTADGLNIINGPLGVTATDNSGAVTFYTRDPQGNILNSHDTTGTRNYVTEYNGSVTALYNPSGSPVGSYTYAPYGTTHANTETGSTEAGTNPFRYISGFQDGTAGGYTGHYKLGARYYDTHGHFTQPDPASPGSGNYIYASSDPINSGDPSGQISFNFNIQGCYYLCIGVQGGVDDKGNFGIGPSGGFGTPGVHAGADVSSSGVAGGAAVVAACNAGPAQISHDFVSGNNNAGLATSEGYGCSLTGSYTFSGHF